MFISSKAGIFAAPVAVLTLSSLSLAAPATVVSQPFGSLPNGQKVTLYTLRNSRGATAKITNYGGILTSLTVPDKRGQMGDVVLGYPTIGGYLNDDKNYGTYMGALVGRYANRIAKGRFTLDGKSYKLATNNGPNHLHGGVRGFNRVLWNAKPITTGNGVALELRYFSKNGEEGYPGNLNSKVIYRLDNQNRLRIDYSAVTDAPTVVNLTHHSYFNLKGAGNGTILDHQLRLNANRFTPIDPTAIPLGQLQNVAGTPFDFRKYQTIGSRIGANHTQIKHGAGYDHNFVLNHGAGTLGLSATVYEPKFGREMRVYTTEPGVQLYTGNYLVGQIGKYGRKYLRRGGFCLEAQHYPDSPNKPLFPSTVLRPGQTYKQTTIYAFSTR